MNNKSPFFSKLGGKPKENKSVRQSSALKERTERVSSSNRKQPKTGLFGKLKGDNQARSNQQRQKKRNQKTEQAKQRQRTIRLKQVKAFAYRFKWVGIIFIALVVLATAITFVLGAVRSAGSSVISEIQVIGETQGISDSILAGLEGYKGKTFAQVSESNLRTDISKAYTLAGRQIKVYKLQPGILRVEIIENPPRLAVLNLKGIYLIDAHNQVIRQLEDSVTPVSTEEIKLLNEPKNVNSDAVKIRYTQNLPDSEKGSIKWEDVPDSEKESVYNILIAEIRSRYDGYFRDSELFFSQSDFKNVPLIVAPFIEFKENLEIDPLISSTTITFVEELEKRAMKVTRKTWLSFSSLQLTTESGKTFLFSSRRDLAEQQRDLDAIIYNGKLNDGNTFDLRSNNFSIY